MGSFDYTCAVSNLPIHAGDKVRCLLLTENPYEDNKGCLASNIHDWWFHRTFPIRAAYNDYGSVENVEEGLARDIWTETLPIDLVARGWGDNTCHDVPTSPDMTFEELLAAVQKGRVRVRQDVGDTITRVKTPKGIPTMKRVTARLVQAGLPLFGGCGTEGFLVDNQGYGTVRVRWHGEGLNWHKDAESLKAAEKALSRYATVLRAGTGNYAASADLFVHVKPGTKDFHWSRKDKKRTLSVSQMMIREDVWQALLGLSIQGRYDSEKTLAIDDFRKAARKLYEKSLSYVAERKARSEELLALLKNDVTWMVASDITPFTVGLATHWSTIVKKGLPIEQVESFLDSVAEMAYVYRVLMQVRFIWVPSSSRGSQYGEFDKHAAFLRALVGIAESRDAEDKEA